MYGYVSSMWQMQDSSECMAMSQVCGKCRIRVNVAMSQVCGKCRIRLNVWLCLKYVANVGFV